MNNDQRGLGNRNRIQLALLVYYHVGGNPNIGRGVGRHVVDGDLAQKHETPAPMPDPPPSSNRPRSAWEHPDLRGGRPCCVRACLYAQPKWIIHFTWWEVQSPRDGSWWENDALSSYPELRAMRQSSLTHTALCCQLLSSAFRFVTRHLLKSCSDFSGGRLGCADGKTLQIFFFFSLAHLLLRSNVFFHPCPKNNGTNMHIPLPLTPVVYPATDSRLYFPHKSRCQALTGRLSRQNVLLL